MNPALKDKAWKFVEIAFYAGLSWLVVSDWKSFVGWLLSSAIHLAIAVLSLLALLIVPLVIERTDYVNSNDNGDAARYFLFRSFVIGAAFGIPGVFFPQTRRVLRFLRDLEGVRIATDLFQLVIVFTLLGLILQGLFYLLRGLKRSFSSSRGA